MTDLAKVSFSMRYRSVFSLICILMQTSGIRFFSGLGSILMIIVILLNVTYIKRFKVKSFIPLIILVFIYICLKIYNKSEALQILTTLLTFTASYFFCLSYVNRSFMFLNDLKIALRLFTIQAFVSIFIYFIFHPFIHSIHIKDSTFITLFYVFYYFLPVDGLLRITGLFWEPGCLQLIANLYLFICINNGNKIKRVLWIVIVIVFVFSTTGFILLILNGIYYIKINTNIRKIRFSIVFLIFFSLFIIPKVFNAVLNKWTNDTSGMIRQVNTIAGLKMTLAHPFTGADTNMDKLKNNLEFNAIEEDFWGVNSSMLPSNLGFVAGGFSNGIFDLTLTWGVFIGLYLFYLFYKSRFFPTSLYAFYFLLLFLFSNMSEALTNTSLFYIFVMSTFVLGKRIQIKL